MVRCLRDAQVSQVLSEGDAVLTAAHHTLIKRSTRHQWCGGTRIALVRMVRQSFGLWACAVRAVYSKRSSAVAEIPRDVPYCLKKILSTWLLTTTLCDIIVTIARSTSNPAPGASQHTPLGAPYLEESTLWWLQFQLVFFFFFFSCEAQK